MSTGIVVFNQQQWAASYPELARCVPNAQGYFDQATLYLANTLNSIVQSMEKRRTLLYMLTAHIAYLTAPGLPRAGSPLVGRISSGTQGSVSVQTTMGMLPHSAEWYAQSAYGFSYWQATKRYRSARYIPGPQPVFAPILPFANSYRVP